MRRSISLAALALAVTGCTGGGGRPPPPPPDVTGALAARSDAGVAGPFRLDDLGALAIEARLHAESAGPRAIRVDVLAPTGSLYAQLRTTIEPPAGGDAAVTQALQVRGSPIDSLRRIGTWRFVLSVEDGPSLAEATVELRE